MDVIFSMCWNIEVEDMADAGNIKTTRCNITGNEQIDFAILEPVERGHTRGLIHVTMQRTSIEAMFAERTIKRCDITLPVAENDRILQLAGFIDQLAERCALVPWFAAG